jgi:uncharacterized protein YbjT (DUF2867 family)
VSWERADVLRPKTYAALLRGADYVVHSLGILLEADYKGVLSGQESPVAGLRKAFAPAAPDRGVSGNPVGNKAEGEADVVDEDADFTPADPRETLTYEVMNRDSALVLARVAARENQRSKGSPAGEGAPIAFVFVSAAGGAPVLPARYISTKREAETAIAENFPEMRGIFIRAPILYDSSRKLTLPIAAAVGLGAAFNGLTRGVLGGFMGSAGVKPLKADAVAEAIVEALADDKVRGAVEVPQIEELAHRAWRKGML